MQRINVLTILLLDDVSTVNISSNLDFRRFGICLAKCRGQQLKTPTNVHSAGDCTKRHPGFGQNEEEKMFQCCILGLWMCFEASGDRSSASKAKQTPHSQSSSCLCSGHNSHGIAGEHPGARIFQMLRVMSVEHPKELKDPESVHELLKAKFQTQHRALKVLIFQ